MNLKDYLYILKKNFLYFLAIFLTTFIVYSIFVYTRPIQYKAYCSVISNQTISDIALQVATGIPLVGEAETTPDKRILKANKSSFLNTVNEFTNVIFEGKSDMENLQEQFAQFQEERKKLVKPKNFLKEVKYDLHLAGSNEIVINVYSKNNIMPVYVCAGFTLAFLEDGYKDANQGFKNQLEYHKKQHTELEEKLQNLRKNIPYDYTVLQNELKQLETLRNGVQQKIDNSKKTLEDNTDKITVLRNIAKQRYIMDDFFDEFASDKTKRLKNNLDEIKMTMAAELLYKKMEHPDIKKLQIKMNAIQDALFKSYETDILTSIIKTDKAINNLKQEIDNLEKRLRIYDDKIGKVKTSLSSVNKYIKEEEQINRQLDYVIDNINKYTNLLELKKGFVEIGSIPRLLPIREFRFSKYLPIMLLLGIALGLVAVYIREYMEPNIINEVDVKKYMGYECLGMVPLDKSNDESNIILYKDEQLDTPSGEIYKSISSLIIKKMSDLKTNMFIISGTGRYVGKTTISLNLSFVLSKAGYRCALVDLDLRTKSLTSKLKKYFDLNPRNPDFANKISYIDIPWKHNEILENVTTGKLEQLLSELRSQYDVVILDAPPLVNVGETLFLVRIIKNLLLVIASGEVSKAKCRWIKHLIDTLGTNVIGVILNKSPLEITPTYYYYYKYGYYKK